jgi:hypothetical protein
MTCICLNLRLIGKNGLALSATKQLLRLLTNTSWFVHNNAHHRELQTELLATLKKMKQLLSKNG